MPINNLLQRRRNKTAWCSNASQFTTNITGLDLPDNTDKKIVVEAIQ